jgi:beta-glucanase (GH16 family)
MSCSFFEPLEHRRLLSVSPIPGNWDLKWSDEFNSTPSTPTWVDTLWGATNFSGELENYTPANVTTSNGIASLTAKQQSSNGFPYTSGLIDTGGDFATGGRNQPGESFQYGYIEARMKLTTGSGMWPAFWMMPTPYANGTYHDGDGEIDIMEQVGTDPTVTEAHLHHNTTVGKSYDTRQDLSAGFHTYGLDWESDHLTWYFDGTPFYTVTANVPNVPEYVIFNLAIGDANSWPGAPTSSTPMPQSFQIDYVRLYEPSSSSSPPPQLLGDTNLDGKVDIADLGNLAGNFGKASGATWAQGDFNGDGKVDIVDLSDLSGNFGKTSTSSGAIFVTAPTAAAPAAVPASTPSANTSSTQFAQPAATAAASTGLTTDLTGDTATSLVKTKFSTTRIK